MIRHHGEHAAKQVFEPTAREVIDADQLSDKGDYHDHLRGSRNGDNGFTKNDCQICAEWASNKSREGISVRFRHWLPPLFCKAGESDEA